MLDSGHFGRGLQPDFVTCVTACFMKCLLFWLSSYPDMPCSTLTGSFDPESSASPFPKPGCHSGCSGSSSSILWPLKDWLVSSSQS